MKVFLQKLQEAAATAVNTPGSDLNSKLSGQAPSHASAVVRRSALISPPAGNGGYVVSGSGSAGGDRKLGALGILAGALKAHKASGQIQIESGELPGTATQSNQGGNPGGLNMLGQALRRRLQLSDRVGSFKGAIGGTASSSSKVGVKEEPPEQELDVIGMVKGEAPGGAGAKTTLKDRLNANQKRNMDIVDNIYDKAERRTLH